MFKKTVKIFSKVLTYILTVLASLIIIFAIYNFVSVKILKNDYTNVFGYTFFEVISGSMSPTIEKNDLIFVKVGDDYKTNDIVTFKSDEAFITHRIISIDDENDIVVTRGDANNSLDNPVNRENIVGKVVKTIPSFGLWISIITTPKVAIAILITFILVTFCISYGNRDDKILEESKDVRKRERKMEDKKHNYRLIVEVSVLFVLLVILGFLIPFTLSRFKTEARSDAKIDIAFYLVKDDYQYKNLKLEDIVPSNNYYTYNFTVSNNDGTNRTETKLKYDLEILATTNLPLEYELYLNSVDDDIKSSAIASDAVEQDEHGTYFRTIKGPTRNFGFDINETDTYQLIVKFPIEYKDYKYQNVSENIEIRINSSQILESDN